MRRPKPAMTSVNLTTGFEKIDAGQCGLPGDHDPVALSLVRSTHDHRAAYRLPALRCDQPFTARTAARWRQVRILSPAALRRTAGGAGRHRPPPQARNA